MTEAGMDNPDEEIQLGKNAADAAKQVWTHVFMLDLQLPNLQASVHLLPYRLLASLEHHNQNFTSIMSLCEAQNCWITHMNVHVFEPFAGVNKMHAR